MNKKYDITGKKFGYLTVICQDPETIGQRNSMWICKCKCGNTTVAMRGSLVNGHTTSCGCKLYESRNFTHGMSKTRIYNIWIKMKRRCSCQKDSSWKYYGGRGITVCSQWADDFVCFYDWAIENGYTDDLTIERIDVNGNYEPSNCEWIPKAEQSDNRRNNITIKYNGEQVTISKLSSITGIPLQTLHRRYYRAKELGKPLTIEKLTATVNTSKTSFRYRKDDVSY